MSRTRLTAEERHEQLIAAAITAFSEGGYAGTTTDQVARLAGVSQPYVIRLFRTKQELFLAAVNHASERIEQVWRDAAVETPTLAGLGASYKALLVDPRLMTVLLHGFTAGGDPAIGEQVRACFGRMYQLVRELTGASCAETTDFFAHGMLLTVLASMHAVGPQAATPPQAWVADLLGSMEHKI